MRKGDEVTVSLLGNRTDTSTLRYCSVCGICLVSCEENKCVACSDTKQSTFTKFDQDKLPMHLVEPVLIEQVAKVLAIGAKKYGEDNWKSGTENKERIYAAAMRHLLAWRRGEKQDPESGLSHAAHVACNMMFLLFFESDNQET